MPKTTSLRLSVAQLTVRPDPGDTAALRESGEQIRHLMRDAHAAGARLLHLPEGALTCPNKKIMSSTGPDKVGPADWDRADWTTLAEELHRPRCLQRPLGRHHPERRLAHPVPAGTGNRHHNSRPRSHH